MVAAAYNREGMLPALVRALRAQTHPDVEFVIVDNGSTDRTRAVLAELTAGDPRFRVLTIDDNRGPARARNLAWRSSDRPWIAFTDDDCEPAPDWVERLVAATAGGADIVQGTTLPPEDELAVATRFDKIQRIRSWTGRYQTCNLLVAHDVLADLDGFNERFRIAMGEDTDFGLRAEAAGVETAFEPSAVVTHMVWARGYAGYLRDRWRWADIVALIRENPRARRMFPWRYFAGEMHVVVYASLPVLALAVWLGWWFVVPLAVAGWCGHRTWTARHNGEPVAVRAGRAGLELVGIGWEVVCFAVKSIRYRRVLL